MWKNILQWSSPQLTIWPMCIACCIPRATNTPSDCVILLFHRNSCYMNTPQCYAVCTLPVLFCVGVNRAIGQRSTVCNVGCCAQPSIQRITRYPLLLAHLYKVTRPDDDTRELFLQSQHQ
jgi:hypothetical protein